MESRKNRKPWPVAERTAMSGSKNDFYWNLGRVIMFRVISKKKTAGDHRNFFRPRNLLEDAFEKFESVFCFKKYTSKLCNFSRFKNFWTVCKKNHTLGRKDISKKHTGQAVLRSTCASGKLVDQSSK